MQPLQNCIGPTIRIGREILCLPYVGFFIYIFFYGQCGEASRWRVCYQRGLPRLVWFDPEILNLVADPFYTDSQIICMSQQKEILLQ